MALTMALAMMTTGCATYAPAVTPETTVESTTSSETTNAEEGAFINGDKISAEAAKELMLQNPDAIILDVRTQEEYQEGHIAGAVLLPIIDLEAQASTVLPDKDALILLYCRSGNRSGQATSILLDMGYSKIQDFGGIIDWPYEIVKD